MTGWRKSSYCSAGCNCIWVDIRPDVVCVTTEPLTGPRIYFTHAEWAAFLAGVHNGEFDL